MTAVIASIDIGSHTARLLVARTGDASSFLTPLVRRRAYTRIAGDFVDSGRRKIPESAVKRLLGVLDEFMPLMDSHRVTSVRAVGTGVLREADNSDMVFEAVRRHTGLQIRCISGAEEAALACTGVVGALGLENQPCVVFDLGGGSTEVVVRGYGESSIRSLPLGASVLKAIWLPSDPPGHAELERLESEIGGLLAGSAIHAPETAGELVVAGTGGTVTALAAVTEGLNQEEIVPERINGVIVDLFRVEELLGLWKSQGMKERMKFSGLEAGRAEVIVPGAMVVSGILRYFGAGRLTASMSDLLEGLIIQSGVGNE